MRDSRKMWIGRAELHRMACGDCRYQIRELVIDAADLDRDPGPVVAPGTDAVALQPRVLSDSLAEPAGQEAMNAGRPDMARIDPRELDFPRASGVSMM